ncbi:MAG TPA: hypothetical protein VGY98_16105 [Verrucomicrobiae bacterium]|nr:hypothetical protein [Verrucomicrobiae bacterium]
MPEKYARVLSESVNQLEHFRNPVYNVMVEGFDRKQGLGFQHAAKCPSDETNNRSINLGLISGSKIAQFTTEGLKVK